MIPRSFSGRLAEPSPQQTERDLARLINRTAELAAAARHQLGYAAVNIGCDGITRVTMFDGSSCQVSGNVCLATREEGITVCLDTPRGNGLNFQRVAFSAPDCAPVTGWWIVDATGYMYRLPQGLITPAPYWPMSAAAGAAVTLVRAGTWAKLMCGAALTIALNDAGGAQWVNEGEAGEWTQIFAAALGGVHSQWLVVPTVTVSLATEGIVEVGLSGGESILSGIVDTDGTFGSLSLDLTDGDLVNLTVGQEYTAAIYLAAGGVAALRGSQAPSGASVAPTIPDEALPIATVVVPYDTTAATYTLTATTSGRYGLGWTPTSGGAYSLTPAEYRAVLLRDDLSPNAGLRVVSVTLPSAVSGVVSGLVRVAYGYPLGQRLDTAVPGVVGTWQADCVGRVVGDMAGAYRRSLAVEYGEGHICLDGAAITDADDYVATDEIDRTNGPALDVASGVLGLPSAEVALLSPYDTRTGERYRLRPAPDTAPTITVEQQAKGAWGEDPNLWVEESNYEVGDWLEGATEFTVVGSGDTAFPGRAVPAVLWEALSGSYLDAVVAYPCTLGPTSAGLTTLTFGPGVSVAASTLGSPYQWLTVPGWRAYAAWGWTFEIDGIESALSPLTDEGALGYRLTAPSALYSVKVGVPLGPAGTTRRHVYRYLYSVGPTQSDTVGPWGAAIGGLYDRHCRLVATIEDNVTTEIYDEDVSLSTAGTRPPSPLIYVGPMTLDAPLPVHFLQPMDL